VTSQYDAIAERTLAIIARKGAANAFLVVTAGVDNPSTGLPPTSTTSVVTGSAVEAPGDPDIYLSLDLVRSNPVTLYVAAKGLGVIPTPGMNMTWAGRPYTVRLATPTGPDGVPILWTLVGSS
jgi:hypothetical protein